MGVVTAWGVRVSVEVMVEVAVEVGVGVKVAVKVGVRVGVEVGIGVSVGVFVGWATVTVTPDTGKPLKSTVWPLFPAAPVKLKL